MATGRGAGWDVMFVGVLTVDLYLEEARSLKDRRRILKSILTRLRQRYNVSAAEIGSPDRWQRAQLGMAVVSNSHTHAREVLDELMRFIEAQGTATILNHFLECR